MDKHVTSESQEGLRKLLWKHKIQQESPGKATLTPEQGHK